MKKLLFSLLLGAFSAIQAMQAPKQMPKAELDQLVSHRKWRVLAKEIAASKVSLTDLVWYTKAELDKKSNEGETLLQNLMYVIRDSLAPEDIGWKSTDETNVCMRALEVLIVTDKITHDIEMVNAILEKKSFNDHNRIDQAMKTKCVQLYVDKVAEIEHHKTQIEQLLSQHAITENKWEDLIWYMHNKGNGLPAEYLIGLSDEQRRAVRDQIVREGSSEAVPGYFGYLYDAVPLLPQVGEKAANSYPIKSAGTMLRNKKYFAIGSIAVVAIGGLIAYYYFASPQDEEAQDDDQGQEEQTNAQGA